MKKYYLTKDEKNKLHICGIDEAALEWEISKNRIIIGKIESDLDILELTKFINGGE